MKFAIQIWKVGNEFVLNMGPLVENHDGPLELYSHAIKEVGRSKDKGKLNDLGSWYVNFWDVSFLDDI